jgi:glucosamine--fructose-6-phosphate aminotransferase (isomerizing)
MAKSKGSRSKFLQEVAEHPQALNALVSFYRGAGRARLAAWKAKALAAKRVRFAGMGTSEFAAEMILSALSTRGIEAGTADAGELFHYPRSFAADLPVLISQSGESVETRKLAESLPAGAEMIAVTNHEESAIARRASLALPIHAGDEAAISTKTYVNTLAVLFLMAESLGGDEALERALERLSVVAGMLDRHDAAAIAAAADLLADARAIHFVARGPAVVAARQAALTFMEGTRTSATAFTGGGFRHGPLELAGPDHRAVIFAPQGKTAELMASLVRELSQKGGKTVVMTDWPDGFSASGAQVIAVPRAGEDLFPPAVAPAQELLLHALAQRRGVEAGIFRYGGKITLRE